MTLPVSAIIPAYRAAGVIRRAVDSVLAQSVQPAEVLVVDDGSPDGDALKSVLQSYGGAVTLLTKPNGGAASARNHGIDRAREEWIAFLDADDYWEAEKLERQFAAAQSDPQLGVVGCRWYEEHPGRTRTPSRHDTLRYSGRLLRPSDGETFDVAMNVWTGSLLIRRDLLEEDRFLSGLEPAEDRDLWVRLLSKTSAYILPDLLATYVQEPGGISRTNIDRDCGNMLEVVHRHAALLGPAGVKSQEARLERRWAAGYLSQRRGAKAFPHALARLRREPSSAEAWWIVVKSAGLSLLG